MGRSEGAWVCLGPTPGACPSYTSCFQVLPPREHQEDPTGLVPGSGGAWVRPGGLHGPRLDAAPPPQDEKEQLNEYKGHLSGLAKRAKAIVQLKPRHPAHPMRGRLPLLAVCDYKQVEVSAGRGSTGGRGQAGQGVAMSSPTLPVPGDCAQG